MPPGASIDMAERSMPFRGDLAFCAPRPSCAEPSSTFAGASIGSTSLTLLRRKSTVAGAAREVTRVEQLLREVERGRDPDRRTTRSAPTQASMRRVLHGAPGHGLCVRGHVGPATERLGLGAREPGVVLDHVGGNDLARDVGGVDAVDLLDCPRP